MYPNRALGLRVLTAVLMFLESFVDSSACLTNVLLPAVGLSAGQQVQAPLICAGHVLENVVLFSRVMDIHHLNYSSWVSSSSQVWTYGTPLSPSSSSTTPHPYCSVPSGCPGLDSLHLLELGSDQVTTNVLASLHTALWGLREGCFQSFVPVHHCLPSSDQDGRYGGELGFIC